jgi:hypothetical protein
MEKTVAKKTRIQTKVRNFQACDACSARAKFNVQFSFGELDFCSHHFRLHEIVITTISISVQSIGGANN